MCWINCVKRFQTLIIFKYKKHSYNTINKTNPSDTTTTNNNNINNNNNSNNK